METTLKTLYQLTKLIIHLGVAARFTSGLFGSIYLGLCIAIPSIFIVELLPFVLITGALLGYGVQGIFVLINAPTKDQVLQKTIDSMWDNVDLGRIPESEASEITTEAFRQLILSPQETESTNGLKSEKQRQISPTQEEE